MLDNMLPSVLVLKVADGHQYHPTRYLRPNGDKSEENTCWETSRNNRNILEDRENELSLGKSLLALQRGQDNAEMSLLRSTSRFSGFTSVSCFTDISEKYFIHILWRQFFFFRSKKTTKTLFIAWKLGNNTFSTCQNYANIYFKLHCANSRFQAL